MKRGVRLIVALGCQTVIAPVLSAPASAQLGTQAGSAPMEEQESWFDNPAPSARTAEMVNGRAGERQNKAIAGITLAPTARIDSRIQNRIENRLRNRIDQYYDPRANADRPFAVVGAQTRKRR